MCTLPRRSAKGLSFSLSHMALPYELAASLKMPLPEFLKYNQCPSDGSDNYRKGSIITVPFDYPTATVEGFIYFEHWLVSK